MAKKKLTKMQQEYNKQVKRLKSAMRKAEKRGYIFEDNVIPDKPKRVTKQFITELKRIKPEHLYKYAQKVDFETGELIEGKKARKLEKELAKQIKKQQRKQQTVDRYTSLSSYEDYDTSQFPDFSEIVIQNFFADMSRFPEVAYPIFKNWIENLQKTRTDNEIAEMLEESKSRGLFPDYKVAYNKELIFSAISEMINYLPELTYEDRQALTNAFENEEDWADIDEN